jgi:hypothetical protein
VLGRVGLVEACALEESIRWDYEVQPIPSPSASKR